MKLFHFLELEESLVMRGLADAFGNVSLRTGMINVYQLMRSNSTFKLWDSTESFQHNLRNSQSQNRLRKSLQNVKNLRLDLFKLRTSFSNSSIPQLDSPLSPKISNYPLMPAKKASQGSQSSLHLKLQSISKKLKDAHSMIDHQKEHCEAKTIRKIETSTNTTTSHHTKESALETQRTRQRNRLAHYTTVAPKPENIRPATHNPYTLRLNKYYVSEAVRAVHEKNSLAMEHINQSMQMLLQYKLFKINQQSIAQEERIDLPVTQSNKNKKTLILDLDETLIHCFEKNQSQPDIKLTISIDGCPFEIGFNIRPYAISFLKKMKKHWEIIVFTASHQSYADTILDQIDPQGVLFDHRLYRQHCRELTTDFFVKDLSRINRDLSKVVLVDNSAYSYAMQLDNGIPILPFYEGKDFELTALEHYMQKLRDCSDVRVVNREYFRLHSYTSFDNALGLVEQLYSCK